MGARLMKSWAALWLAFSIVASPAFAQEEPAVEEAPVAELAPEQSAEAAIAPAERTAEHHAPETTPTSESAVDTETPPEEPAAEAPAPAWHEGLSISAFADAYVQGIWTLRDPLSGDRSDVMGHRAFDTNAGLTLAFLGLNATFAYESVGARVDLRFGTAMPRLVGPTSGLPDGMQFVKQAFVYWRPLDNLQIDFGQFDTIYGAEVSESWLNHNYSRGSLYNLVQPFYHTGFRASWAPIDGVTVTGIAVNGWNNVLDNNDGKTFGAQVGWSNDNVRVIGGYLTGPEGDDDGLWRHFADLVVGVTFGDFEVLANADYVAEDNGDGTFNHLWGAMLSGCLKFPPLVHLALRGEVIADPDDDWQLLTGTFTVGVTPVEHLVIRLDNRLDYATDARFQDRQYQPSEVAFSSVLGVVVHSD